MEGEKSSLTAELRSGRDRQGAVLSPC